MPLPRLKPWLCLLGVLAAFLALLASPSVADQAQEEAARDLLNTGFSLANAAEYEDALAVYAQVQADYPGTEAAGYAIYRTGTVYLLMSRHADAVNQGKAVAAYVAEHPNPTLAKWGLCLLGEALVANGQMDAGVTELLKAAALEPATDASPTR